MTFNKGRNWAFIGVMLWFKICFRSTHVAEQHIFSMSPLILAFDFLSKLRVIVLGQKLGYFEGWGQVQFVVGSTHIVQQLLFSLFPSIVTFDFDLILRLFLTFCGTNGLFLGSMWGSKTVLGTTHRSAVSRRVRKPSFLESKQLAVSEL